jgi:hypothetical protein
MPVARPEPASRLMRGAFSYRDNVDKSHAFPSAFNLAHENQKTPEGGKSSRDDVLIFLSDTDICCRCDRPSKCFLGVIT